jgi:hypothetical protein
MNGQIRRDELQNGLFPVISGDSWIWGGGLGLWVSALTPPRRWERSCAAPSQAHPLTTPQAHLHTQR